MAVQFKLVVNPDKESMESAMNEASSEGWSLEFFSVASSGHAVALFSKQLDAGAGKKFSKTE